MANARLLQLLSSVAPLAASVLPLEGADFTAGFDGVPESVTGAPGELKTFDVFITLSTASSDPARGAQGWVLLARVDGGNVRRVSVDGLEVRALHDHDGDLATPLRPRSFRLADSFFQKHLPYAADAPAGSAAGGAYTS